LPAAFSSTTPTLLPATLADMQAKGIKAAITLTASKGSNQVPEIVPDAVENHKAISKCTGESTLTRALRPVLLAESGHTTEGLGYP